MRKLALTVVMTALLPTMAFAGPYDTIGAVNSVTTMHHCGYVPSTAKLYTSSEVTSRIVERKLIALGYTQASANGKYSKKDKRAVKQFQDDYGLKVDGIVGPVTAQRLAYVSHSSAHVRDCI